jgi:hypothetical protein
VHDLVAHPVYLVIVYIWKILLEEARRVETEYDERHHGVVNVGQPLSVFVVDSSNAHHVGAFYLLPAILPKLLDLLDQEILHRLACVRARVCFLVIVVNRDQVPVKLHCADGYIGLHDVVAPKFRQFRCQHADLDVFIVGNEPHILHCADPPCKPPQPVGFVGVVLLTKHEHADVSKYTVKPDRVHGHDKRIFNRRHLIDINNKTQITKHNKKVVGKKSLISKHIPVSLP